MGLDNGFVMKLRAEEFDKFPKKFLNKIAYWKNTDESNLRHLVWECKSFKPMDATFDIEVCYWRKCWGLRNLVINYLSSWHEGNEEGAYQLDAKKIRVIANDILAECNNKEWWDVDGESIWTYSEFHKHLERDIDVLNMLADFLENNNVTWEEFYFYDSY